MWTLCGTARASSGTDKNHERAVRHRKKVGRVKTLNGTIVMDKEDRPLTNPDEQLIKMERTPGRAAEALGTRTTTGFTEASPQTNSDRSAKGAIRKAVIKQVLVSSC